MTQRERRRTNLLGGSSNSRVNQSTAKGNGGILQSGEDAA